MTARPSRRARLRNVGLLVAALAVSGVLLAACGGGSSASGSSGSGSSSTSSPSASAAGSFSAFAACLKSHGVTFPAGRGFGGGGAGAPTGTAPTGTFGSGSPAGGRPAGGFTRSAKDQKAFTACAKFRPKGSFGGFGGFGGGGSGAAALAPFRNCMKLHGVALPTAGARPSGSTGTTTGTSITSNPHYASAFSACKALLPTPTTTTTSGAS